MIFAFADCEIDVDRRELRRQGALSHVEPQVLDVLIHLIRHRDRVVAKDELFDLVWKGRIVSEATLISRISAARRAIGDSGERQVYLRTVARHGFRFCGEVHERMQQHAALRAMSAAGDPPVSLVSETATALPIPATSLLGRTGDTVEVAALLATSRLVTLTGAGGVGKTRLAIHVAGEAAPDYPDGVYLVELAAVSDSGVLGHVVAGVLGVSQLPGKTIEQSVVRSLAGCRLLLVLDNCEHLVDAVAALVREIIANCPRVTLLTTSREALTIDGEQVWPVPPLDFEGIDSPAVQLFMDRARAVAPKLMSDPDHTVSDICRRLDGLPLAIELAAARTHVMSPSQISDRLNESFRLLNQGSRRTVERHRTLRHAIQWSFDLLSVPERTLPAGLSVFAGGFTLKAAEQVCREDGAPIGDVLDGLDSLARKSLITVERSDSATRYGLLETIRQFAQEQLALTGAAEAAPRRHAQYFADDCDAHFKIWRSARQHEAYEWLDREMGNLRAAFRWASARGEIDIAARIAAGIGDMARFRLRGEAATWAGEIVEAARKIRHRRLMTLLTWAASSAWSLAQLEAARRFGEEAVSLNGDMDFDQFVWAFTDLAMVAAYEGDVGRAIEFARAGAEHAGDRHDRFCLAMLPYFMALDGSDGEATTASNTGFELVEAAAVPACICIALWSRGKAFAATDPEQALAAYQRAIAVAHRSGNRFWEIMITLEAAALQARRGDPISALRAFQQMLALWRRSTDLMFVSHGLGSLIVLLDRVGRADAAATLNGVVARTFDSNPFVAELADTMWRVRRALGEESFQEADRSGTAMALHEAYDYANDQVRQALEALGVAY
jgi:predicted ATPase/DNA-binding winged helix-turn-helix (wHTH) protein